MHYKDFKKAREFVRSIRINRVSEWKAYCRSGRKPQDIPRCPEVVYCNSGWAGYGDWLGTGRIASFNRKYCSYEDAREHVSRLGLKGFMGWQDYCKSGKKPANIPARPERTYKDRGWINWKDWLGSTSSYSYTRYHLRFKEAREYARGTGIKKTQEWYAFCKSGAKNPYVPSNPHKAYSNSGWAGMKDWLGTKDVK